MSTPESHTKITKAAIERMTSLTDLERLRATIAADIQSIQAQLGTRKLEVAESALPKDYVEWRGRAAYALKCRLSNLRECNIRIKELRDARLAESLDVDLGDPVALLGAAHTLVRRVIARSTISQLDPDEQGIMDAIRNFLLHRG